MPLLLYFIAIIDDELPTTLLYSADIVDVVSMYRRFVEDDVSVDVVTLYRRIVVFVDELIFLSIRCIYNDDVEIGKGTHLYTLFVTCLSV